MKPNYEIENYCVRCDKTFPKIITRCPDCHMNLRSTPHSGLRNKKYQDRKARM